MNHFHDFSHFIIDHFSGLLTIWLRKVVTSCACRIVERKCTDIVTHAIVFDHAIGHLSQFLQVVLGTGRRFSIHDLFSHAPAYKRTHFIYHLRLCPKFSLLRKIPGCAKCLTTRNQCHLEERIRIWEQPADSSVSCFVMSDGFLLRVGNDGGFAFKTTYNSVHGIQEILFVNGRLVLSCRSQRSFIADIGNIRSGKSRSVLGHEIHIKVGAELQILDMHLENLLSFLEFRKFYVNLSVETACTKKSLVEDICPVGGCKHDYT